MSRYPPQKNTRNRFFAILAIYCCFLLYLPASLGDLFSNQNTNMKILIGNNPDQDRPWKGALISLSIYDKALSSNQIQQHYQNRLSESDNMALQEGLIFKGSSMLIDPEEEKKIDQKIHATRQVTVEAWIDSERQWDAGGRFFSFVHGDRSLFYLDQEIDEMIIGARYSILKRWRFHSEGVDETALSGKGENLLHLVGVYHPEKITLYLNGNHVAEGWPTNHLFMLANYLNLDRMPFGGRGLLGILLFWPLGFFFSLSFKNISANLFYPIIASSLFSGLILLMQSQNDPPFFILRTAWVPFFASILGVISGERIQEDRSTPNTAH